MPTAESEETMHLFIDFLAEGRICQTVCARTRQRRECMSVRVCGRAGAPIYDTLQGSKRNVIRARGDAGRAGEGGSARQQAYPLEPCS